MLSLGSFAVYKQQRPENRNNGELASKLAWKKNYASKNRDQPRTSNVFTTDSTQLRNCKEISFLKPDLRMNDAFIQWLSQLRNCKEFLSQARPCITTMARHAHHTSYGIKLSHSMANRTVLPVSHVVSARSSVTGGCPSCLETCAQYTTSNASNCSSSISSLLASRCTSRRIRKSTSNTS